MFTGSSSLRLSLVSITHLINLLLLVILKACNPITIMDDIVIEKRSLANFVASDDETSNSHDNESFAEPACKQMKYDPEASGATVDLTKNPFKSAVRNIQLLDYVTCDSFSKPREERVYTTTLNENVSNHVKNNPGMVELFEKEYNKEVFTNEGIREKYMALYILWKKTDADIFIFSSSLVLFLTNKIDSDSLKRTYYNAAVMTDEGKLQLNSTVFVISNKEIHTSSMYQTSSIKGININLFDADNNRLQCSSWINIERFDFCPLVQKQYDMSKLEGSKANQIATTPGTIFLQINKVKAPKQENEPYSVCVTVLLFVPYVKK